MASGHDQAALRDCDIFIIGSGLIGSTFARILVEAGADVVIAEAGDFHSRRAGENRKNSWINQRDLVQYGHFVRAQLHPVPSIDDMDYPAAQVSYAVGGMAAHWTCAIPEFHPRLERMAYITDEEWRALYAQAAVLLNRHDDVFAGSARHHAIQRALTAGGWVVRDTPMAAERKPGSAYASYTGADTVLGRFAEPGASSRFTIVPEHGVRRLVRAPGNTHRIDHAEVVDLRTGAITRVHADRFVVAAGWLHNAQLLWASDIHAGGDGALGRYFSDHTFGACTVLLDPKLIDPIPADDPPPHLYLPVSDERPWQGMIFRESYQFESAAGGAGDLRGIDLKWFGMIAPARDNRVTFSDSRHDALGMPVAAFRLKLSDADRDLQDRMMADMRSVAGQLGTFRPGAEPGLAPLGSAIHATGLTRMGPPGDGGATSVVDPWSKIWGLDNCHVGGTSVIPTPTAANPTFTAVALAVRAAQSITAAQT